MANDRRKKGKDRGQPPATGGGPGAIDASRPATDVTTAATDVTTAATDVTTAATDVTTAATGAGGRPAAGSPASSPAAGSPASSPAAGSPASSPAAGSPGAADRAASRPGASGSSGSIEVQFSSPGLPSAGGAPAPDTSALDEPTDVARPPTTDAARSAQPALDPIDDLPDPDALEPEHEHARSSMMMVARRAEELLGQGVSKLGEGIGTIGKGMSRIGERAAKVPVLGESVKNLGEGISEVGTSLHELPSVTQSRRGRLLVRSMLVAFLLVFAWISAIVLLQLRDSKKPDFRPLARKILVAVRDGHADAVWAEASPRFQEVVREQRFVDDMADMKRTLGAFREIAAINDTIVTTGPSGRIGRVALTLQFEKGRARANVSFHRDGGRWKLLGLAVDTPPELPITQESRKERSELPEDARQAALVVLRASNVEVRASPEAAPRPGRGSAREDEPAPEQLRDQRSEQLWDSASDVFRSSTTKAEFVRLQRERHQQLGNFLRVIEYKSGSKKYADLQATFTGLVEYQAGVVSAAVGFVRADERAPWILSSFKVVLPMPRADQLPPDDGAEREPRDDEAPARTDRPRAPAAQDNGAAGPPATSPRAPQDGGAGPPPSPPADRDAPRAPRAAGAATSPAPSPARDEVGDAARGEAPSAPAASGSAASAPAPSPGSAPPPPPASQP